MQAYGHGLGVQLLARGEVKRSLRYLAVPVNYWRSLEYSLVCREGGFGPLDRVLDIGSPKLLALYIAERLGASVVATDILEYFVSDYRRLRQLRGVNPARLRLMVEDGRRLSFEAEAFTKVYSISVLEHIPGSGDSECIREIARVLRPGGRCILTVPFWPTSRADWREPDFYWAHSSLGGAADKVFFQRRYSQDDLHARLIGPSGLRLAKLRFVGERVLAASRREVCEFLPPLTGPLQPLLSWLLLTRPAEDWRKLVKPLCALIVMEKPLD